MEEVREVISQIKNQRQLNQILTHRTGTIHHLAPAKNQTSLAVRMAQTILVALIQTKATQRAVWVLVNQTALVAAVFRVVEVDFWTSRNYCHGLAAQH